ncbi:hypothetical protein PUR59_15095 [Streptomyces sp. SP18ES09]|uniref:hypothetical protein n=1 Tax=Streptomyces sp. SP18ES09 TaxID=3002532 RepID=UPI002E7A4B20|nr:hypothetical protein [Streptomyces sp. SP18ES09]MEE1816335.1 hypothetical protein [Streptomyces sp. SP18ES09]
MGSSARRLAALVPALLCALWSLLALPPATAPPQDLHAAAAVRADPVLRALRPEGPGSPAVTLRTEGSGSPAVPIPSDPGRGYGPGGAPSAAGSHTVPRAASPEAHFAATAAVGLPAAVENPTRFPSAPAAPPVAPADLTVSARGLLAGDPCRERAPPAAAHGPRVPRGPPSTRHS